MELFKPSLAFIPGVPVRPSLQSTTLYICAPPNVRSHVTPRRRAPSCVIVDPSTVLTAEQLKEWEEVSTLVQNLDPTLAPDKADKLVGRAFGWGTQKFWRGRVKQEPPSLDAVRTSLSFLSDEVAVDDSHVPAVLRNFPEVLALSVSRMKENVDFIQRTYPVLKGDKLTKAILENPAVLGFDFDCEGDCKSECARCWVQF